MGKHGGSRRESCGVTKSGCAFRYSRVQDDRTAPISFNIDHIRDRFAGENNFTGRPRRNKGTDDRAEAAALETGLIARRLLRCAIARRRVQCAIVMVLVMHGVLGVFVAMTPDLRRVGMAGFVRHGAECNSPESAADEGKRDCKREGSPNPVAHAAKLSITGGGGKA